MRWKRPLVSFPKAPRCRSLPDIAKRLLGHWMRWPSPRFVIASSSWLNSNPGERPSSNLWENVSYSVMPSASRSCRLRPWWLWKMRLLPSDPVDEPGPPWPGKKVLSPWPNGCEITRLHQLRSSRLRLRPFWFNPRKKTRQCRIRQPPWPVLETSWPNGSVMMRQLEAACGIFIRSTPFSPPAL